MAGIIAIVLITAVTAMIWSHLRAEARSGATIDLASWSMAIVFSLIQFAIVLAVVS